MDEKRFNELYNRAYEKGYACYTEFLNLNEQSILESTYLPYVKYGGYPMAERVIAAFGDDISTDNFPISVLEIAPAMQKFADTLTHRDFLGGLMNLGIRRELLGDIVIYDNKGYLLCLNHIKDYIIANLTRLKHTTVSVKEVSHLEDIALKEPESVEIIVSSLRIDAIISAVCKLSRNESSKLFLQDKVFVNSKAVTNSSYNVKDGDIISVRGYGRIQFVAPLRTTKKNRLVVEIKQYK